MRMTAQPVTSDSRVAVITGAARPWGIGRAGALALARRGYDIVVADIREDWGAEGAETIERDTGRSALFVRTDVTSREQVGALVEQTMSRFGRVDALINDAAINFPSKTEDFTDEQFHRMISVNLLGPMLCTQAVVAPMRAAGYGRIVNVASTAPFNPPPASMAPVSLYNAAKGGLIGWTKSAATELAPYGIVVSVVAVGGLSNAMGSDAAPTAEREEYMLNVVHRGMLPWGRTMQPGEAAEILAFVADAPNHALLGATIHASGGRVMPL
jgi:NAD(P)-dependent dehydrogenase (short-subunit alcohol dehydrogenase family)